MLNGISPGDVQVINIPPGMLLDALESKAVDAIVIWPPFVYEAKTRFGSKVVSWSVQTGQEFFWLALTTKEYLKAKNKMIQQVMDALLQSEQFLKRPSGRGKTTNKDPFKGQSGVYGLLLA